MRKPNFLIIGTPKAGTTSLFHYLQQHPDIQFPKMKEPKFFSFRDMAPYFAKDPKGTAQIKKFTIAKLEDYQELFANLTAKNIGEASPDYFHFGSSIQNIYKFNPNMRLVVILRNPVDRA